MPARADKISGALYEQGNVLKVSCRKVGLGK